MDRFEIARALSIAPADVSDAEHTNDGVVVLVRDGGRRLIDTGGQIWALDDHPANRGRHRWQPPAPPAADDEASEEAKDDLAEREGGGVPSGRAEDVLTWVGEDAERARQALTVETERDRPRSTLVERLQKLAG